MESNKQLFLVINSSIPLLSSPNLLSLKGIKQIRQFFNVATLTGFIGFILLTSVIANASPPESYAIHNHADDILPENAHSKRGSTEEWIRGRIVVAPRAGLPAQVFANLLKEHNGKARKIGQSDLYIVDLPEYTEEGVIARLANHPHLKFAELDYIMHSSFTPNDPYYAQAWHLPKIGAPIAWDSSQGTGIVIAILDTGVDGSHPDLAARMVPGWNFYDNNSDTADVHGHGTIVAGAAAASSNNSLGVASVAAQSMIMPVRTASPSATVTGSAIASGLTWAVDNGARVANISYSGVPASSTAIYASEYMKNKGGLVVVAAGNGGKDEGYTPTSAMIPVSATDTKDVKTSFSSYGNYVAISAPGTGIWTTVRNASYGAYSGTSLSSPITAGTVALMMAVSSNIKNTDIENLLFSTAIDLGAVGRDPYYGYGRVNAAAAVQAAIANVPSIDSETPVVSILDPLVGATVADLVPVDIDAIDNVGVTRTELWINNTSVAVDTAAPFAFTWDSKGVANGTANLVVRAFDAAGNMANSNAVSVTVNNPTLVVINDTEPPVVQIVNPVAGNVSGSVTITVNASDNSGAAGIGLSIYVDGALKATGTGSTLSVSWNTRSKNIKAGSHAIQAMARDAAGNTSTTSVTVNVVK